MRPSTSDGSVPHRFLRDAVVQLHHVLKCLVLEVVDSLPSPLCYYGVASEASLSDSSVASVHPRHVHVLDTKPKSSGN